jgi:hypothetical protein
MKLRYHFVGETVGWLVLLQGGTDIWAWPERPSQDLAVGSVPRPVRKILILWPLIKVGPTPSSPDHRSLFTLGLRIPLLKYA